MVKLNSNTKLNINQSNLPKNNMSMVSTPVNNGKINLPWQVPTTSTNPWSKGASGNASYIASQSVPKASQPTKNDVSERTTGWYNYALDRDASQKSNQQGTYNALVGSGHVVWMPDYSVKPSQETVWLRMTEIWPHNLNFEPKTVVPNKTGGWGWWGYRAPAATTPTTPVDDAPPKWDPSEYGFGNTKKEEEPAQPDTYVDDVLSSMQDDLGQSTAWMIYWKVTGDQEQAIQTAEDVNSVYKQAMDWRIDKMKHLLWADPYQVAVSIAGWFNPYGDQAMRDLLQYAPERYQKIMEEVKKVQTGDTANAIASGKTAPSTTKTSTETVNTWVDTWAEWVSSTPQQTASVVQNLSEDMSNNQVATTATQEMLNLNSKIAEYEDKLNNLDREANKVFKGDAPNYLVAAFKSNRRQQYQSEINKLESRYNAALDLYKTELSNAQRKEEMNLKYLQYQQQVSNDNWTRYYQSEQLKQNAIKRVDWAAYRVNNDGTITQLTDNTAMLQYQDTVNQALQWYMSIYTSGWRTKTGSWYKYNVSWWQCETFTDNFTEATTWLRMTWAGWRWWTTAEEKIGYINSFVPEVWSVAVAVWWAYNSKYWHTMLVTWYDPSTGIVDLLWSNKNWDEMVYSTSQKLSTLQKNWLKWFWNPYKDLVAKNAWSVWNYQYSWFNTPMASAFERLSADKDLNGTQRNALPIALEMYDTLYEIANNGQLDALVNNGDLALILKDLKNKKFSNADRWEKFLDSFTKALNNKAAKLVWWDESYSALMALQRVIEAKLRDESGAAISSSEWSSNFSYLLPQAWESQKVKQEKLKAWDRIISTKFITAWWKMSEYVPIFGSSTIRWIWWS